MNEYDKLIDSGNFAIADATMKCSQVFDTHEKALVSISGGADSDIVLDICERVRQKHPIDIVYAFFNTGIEYRATLDHLDYLEDRYGIQIARYRAEKSVPQCSREYGQPFGSKYISLMISRLQNIDFEWEDLPYNELWAKYGACRSGLRWWTNDFWVDKTKPCRFDIGYRRHLKEFMVENPPWFRISPKCCDFAKKKVAKKAIKESGCDLTVVGVRKSEGGSRAIQSKCFDKGIDGKTSTYRPLFWFSNADREAYERLFGITHSDCYEVWGFKRTGCVGCPYARSLRQELETTSEYEPKIFKAVSNVFGDSYEYTRMFAEYKESLK